MTSTEGLQQRRLLAAQAAIRALSWGERRHFLAHLLRHEARLLRRAKGAKRIVSSTHVVVSGAEAVSTFRLLRKMTMANLATASGVPRPTLSDIDDGLTELSPLLAERIGRALQVHPGILMWPSWDASSKPRSRLAKVVAVRYGLSVVREGRYWLGTFPDAPSCRTFADSAVGLRITAQEVLEQWLGAQVAVGTTPPEPERCEEVGMSWAIDVARDVSEGVRLLWERQPAVSPRNPHLGTTLRSFFEELGEWDEIEASTERKGGRMVAATLRKGRRKAGKSPEPGGKPRGTKR